MLNTEPVNDPATATLPCPICPRGQLTFTRGSAGMLIYVCLPCGTTLSVPDDAWRIHIQQRQKADPI
jgi:hypothetical protein